MANVGDFLKFLSAPQYQLSPIVLTLRNFFQFLYRSDEPLQADSIQSFFDNAMAFPHWQQNKRELHDECDEILRAYSSAVGDDTLIQDVDWPDAIQIVEVEKPSIALEIHHNFWTFRYPKGTGQFRIFELDEGRFATLIMKADRSLELHQSSSKFLIRNGNLEPIHRDLILRYSSDLELRTDCMQALEVAPYSLARFQYQDQRVQGNIVRGYVFQHVQNLHGQSLEAHPRLFFALKRLESLFVRKESDPFYNQIVENLERLLHWIRLGEPVNVIEVHEQHLRAQTALEEVFRGDKMLTLLLRDLEHSAAKLPAPTNSQSHGGSSRAKLAPLGRAFRDQVAGALPATETRHPKWKMREQTIEEQTKRTERGLTKSSPRADLRPGDRPMASSKTDTSRSTAKRSTNLASGLTPKKTKFSWMDDR